MRTTGLRDEDTQRLLLEITLKLLRFVRWSLPPLHVLGEHFASRRGSVAGVEQASFEELWRSLWARPDP